jgi:hypothetical protein
VRSLSLNVPDSGFFERVPEALRSTQLPLMSYLQRPGTDQHDTRSRFRCTFQQAFATCVRSRYTALGFMTGSMAQ